MKLWRYGALYGLSTLVGAALAITHSGFLVAVAAVLVLAAVAMPIFFLWDKGSTRKTDPGAATVYPSAEASMKFPGYSSEGPDGAELREQVAARRRRLFGEDEQS